MKIRLFGVLLLFTFSLFAEEGMYPITEIHKLNLKKLGIELSADQIFSENEVSLSDAIVQIGGCTGSFISPEGLILTNHHCAFRAIQNISSTENDYLTNGFVAHTLQEERPAKGYTVRITERVEDVSQRVLNAVKHIEDPIEREKAIEKITKQIVKEQEQKHRGKRAAVSEMFPGKTYYLFIYTYLKDVRLVYAPPRSIGEFGGEFDNWEWPRHTGDFTLMRAYAAPDGSPAEYSEENVPYKPKSYLKVAAKGVEEGDRVFILGYPGRTYRHRTSAFLAFEYEFRMPFVVDWYQWQIDLLTTLGKDDADRSLKFSSWIKGLANTEKNYRGKLQGIRRIGLLEQKKNEEEKIQAFIAENNLKKYQHVLTEIKQIYHTYRQSAVREMLLSYFGRSPVLPAVARTLVLAAEERQKEDLERERAFMDRNFKRTQTYTLLRLKNFDSQADQLILQELLKKAAALPEDQQISALRSIFKLDDAAETRQVISEAYRKTRLSDPEFVKTCFAKTPDELKALNDPLINWMLALKEDYDTLKNIRKERNGKLRRLRALWLEAKQAYLKTDFIPDANGTYRMTFGFIEGYAPADAVYKAPITTGRGILEKHTGKSPFDTPEKLLGLLKAKQFGPFVSKTVGTLPVGILYSCDTTGGNSGSPVLNARGQLVGLNFDRAFEATINDYAWNHQYSRSIGVDIRYILFLLKYFSGAEHLLEEMGVQ
ncbi:S46 family peptidase [Calditrichota bacterium GD2]